MGCSGESFNTLEKAKQIVESKSWPAERCVPVEQLSWHHPACQLNSQPLTVFDVRSPCEFKQGHIPGAISLPLLDDDARAEVGKCFRYGDRREAFELALHKAYPGLSSLLAAAMEQSLPTETKSVLVYCKRGGLRSQSVATFLAAHGLNVYTIQGGYKAFRNWAGAVLERPQKVCMIAGACGSGKTEVLSELNGMGMQVIDLEALACHKGSVFGHLGETEQPSSEQVRNLVAIRWANLDPSCPVFMEDEHVRIGSVCLDASLYRHMRHPSLVVGLQVPFDLRVERILAQYGTHGPEALAKAVRLFQKRIGIEKTQVLIDYLERGELRPVCETSLRTYDAAYEKHLLKDRQSDATVTVVLDSLDVQQAASLVSAAVEFHDTHELTQPLSPTE